MKCRIEYLQRENSELKIEMKHKIETISNTWRGKLEQTLTSPSHNSIIHDLPPPRNAWIQEIDKGFDLVMDHGHSLSIGSTEYNNGQSQSSLSNRLVSIDLISFFFYPDDFLGFENPPTSLFSMLT